MPFIRLLKCTHKLNFKMKNYTTMKNYLIVVLAGVHKFRIATQHHSPSNSYAGTKSLTYLILQTTLCNFNKVLDDFGI